MSRGGHRSGSLFFRGRTESLKRSRPKVLKVNQYVLPPPTVLYVSEAPLIGESSIGALLDKMLAVSKSWTDVREQSSSLLADQQSKEDLAKAIGEEAKSVLTLKDEAQIAFMLNTKLIPLTVAEAGKLYRAFIGAVASLGILKSLGREREARALLDLALWELRLIRISRKLYKRLDRSIYRALYIGDDLAVLLREYESGSSALEPLIEEVARLVTSEIDFALSALGTRLGPKERLLAKALNESKAAVMGISRRGTEGRGP